MKTGTKIGSIEIVAALAVIVIACAGFLAAQDPPPEDLMNGAPTSALALLAHREANAAQQIIDAEDRAAARFRPATLGKGQPPAPSPAPCIPKKGNPCLPVPVTPPTSTQPPVIVPPTSGITLTMTHHNGVPLVDGMKYVGVLHGIEISCVAHDGQCSFAAPGWATALDINLFLQTVQWEMTLTTTVQIGSAPVPYVPPRMKPPKPRP